MFTIKAALFDLDGVVIDTESQYSLFWGSIGRQYRPDVPDFAEHGMISLSKFLKSAV